MEVIVNNFLSGMNDQVQRKLTQGQDALDKLQSSALVAELSPRTAWMKTDVQATIDECQRLATRAGEDYKSDDFHSDPPSPTHALGSLKVVTPSQIDDV